MFSILLAKQIDLPCLRHLSYTHRVISVASYILQVFWYQFYKYTLFCIIWWIKIKQKCSVAKYSCESWRKFIILSEDALNFANGVWYSSSRLWHHFVKKQKQKYMYVCWQTMDRYTTQEPKIMIVSNQFPHSRVVNTKQFGLLCGLWTLHCK